MLDPRTLRGRLTIAYASALAIALLIFGALALAVIDNAQHSALDAQLSTSERALRAIIFQRDGRLMMDEPDRIQLRAIIGGRANATVWDSSGTLVAESGHRTFPELTRLAQQAGEPVFATLYDDNEAQRVLVAPIREHHKPIGAIAVWRETDTITALDRTVALAFAVAIPVLTGLAILFGSAIARSGLAPLDRIATLAGEIEARDLSRRIRLPARNDELGRLAATFDRMLDRLQHAFERERRFTSDASHELRAPLSVIRAEADLALRRQREASEYRRALETIAEEADSLEGITRDLLSAARGEAGGDVERFDLGETTREAAQRLQVLAEQRALHLEVQTNGATAVVAARDAVERAIVTVLHNAIKYAREGGTVTLRVQHEDGEVDVCIADDGPGFSATALQRAFDRFWRDDETRTAEGSGLGLSIAKATVERAGGHIAIRNGPGGGAVVHLRFPQPPGGANNS